MRLVGVRATAPRAAVFERGPPARRRGARPGRRAPETPRLARAAIPYLTEPWYC